MKSRLTIPPVVAAADRLQSAMARLSDALAAGDAKAVLACELPLVDAIRSVRAARTGTTTLTPTDGARLRALVDQARAALGRCVQLGDLVTAVALAARIPQGYGRRGAPVTVPLGRRTVLTRS